MPQVGDARAANDQAVTTRGDQGTGLQVDRGTKRLKEGAAMSKNGAQN